MCGAHERLGQQEFAIMKKLLVVASLATGLAAGAVPAFAQSAATSPPGRFATADNGVMGSVQVPNDALSQPAMSNNAHIGDGARPNYLMRQQQLQNLPGYSPDGAN
jgi:hypothetical protein